MDNICENTKRSLATAENADALSSTPETTNSTASNNNVPQDNKNVNKKNYGNALLDIVSPDSRTLLDGLTPVSEKLPISDDKKVQAETVDNKKTEGGKDDYVIEFEREMEEAQIYINLCMLIINRKNFIFL